MKPRPSGFAAMLVRAWTRIYTLGLSRDLRERRRSEIESDLWESSQQNAILRLLRGMPADVGWRIEQVDGSHPLHTAFQLMTMVGVLVGALVWAFGSLQQSELPPLPLSPAQLHMIEKRPPPPPPPPDPTWDEWLARFNPEPADAKKMPARR